MPWRNGGGVTYEVASSPPGADLADFDWRISIADVETGGPFSAFPDVDRTITLLEGEWMALTVGGRRHRFGLREPFQFDGGSETQCQVPGRSRDLNVMTRRGSAVASVTVLEPAVGAVITEHEAETVLVGLTPGVRVTAADGAEIVLDPLDVVRATGSAGLAVSGGGAVVVIALHPASEGLS